MARSNPSDDLGPDGGALPPARARYPPELIARNVSGKFFEYRGLTLVPGDSLSPDRIIGAMHQDGYVRINAERRAPRGRRRHVVVLILKPNGLYSQSTADLRKLLSMVEREPQARDGALDELIIIAEAEFFTNTHLTALIAESQKKQAGGADPDGRAPFYNAYPYVRFVLVVPEHVMVPRHRIMSKEEVASVLGLCRLARHDLPVVFANDAAVVWIGGREGDVVEIERDSEAAARAISYRRVERAPM
jgi:DNA-directed RNA polymerase subunit H